MPKPRAKPKPKAKSKRPAPKVRVLKGTGPAMEGDFLERWDDNQYAAGNAQEGLTDFMELYTTHPWVYACVNAIAQAIASVPFRFTRNGEEAKNEEMTELFKRPNPYQSYFEFMEAIAIYSELTGNCFLEEVKDKSDKLIGILPLRPDRMKIIPHPRYRIAGYRYKTPKGREIPYLPEEITHLKYFNPLNEYMGVGPGAAAKNGLTQDFWAVAFNKGFFKRGSEPGFVLESDESISEQAYNRLLDAWKKRHQGVDKSHVPALLEEGLKYKGIGMSHKDMEFITTRKMAREEILGTWRVPPVMVGLLEYANYATSREQRKSFWMENIFVKLARIESVFNANLMPEGLEFKFATDQIMPLVEDEQVISDVAMSYVTHGIMTINEVRKKKLNLEPVEWGDKWWAPVGLAPVDSDIHPSTPQHPGNAGPFNTPARQQTTDDMQTGQGHPAFVPKPPETASANAVGTEKMAFERITKNDPNWEDPKDVYYWQRWMIWKQLANADVKEVEDGLAQSFKAQGKAVTELAKPSDWPEPKQKSEEGTLPIEKAKLPASVERWLLGIDKQAPALTDYYTKQAQKLLKKHGNAALGQIGVSGKFNLKNPVVEKWIAKFAADRVSGINAVTKTLLRAQLLQAVENGESFKEAMKRLSSVFEGPIEEFRARRIARTEVVTLTNQAKLDAARQSGIVTKKVWISELLDSTRDSHKDIHGTILPINDKFEVASRSGIDKMDGPGDITADPENVVNCLCIIDYPPETPEFLEAFEEDLRQQKEKRDGEEPAKDNLLRSSDERN